MANILKSIRNNRTVVFGATGRVGSALVCELEKRGVETAAVVRSKSRAAQLFPGTEVIVADLHDPDSVINACRDAHTLFLVTPEDFSSATVWQDGARIIRHYVRAIRSHGIRRVVALSSGGAQSGHAGYFMSPEATKPDSIGNLEISNWLEHAISDLPVEQYIIRPAYYYSNWMGNMDVIRGFGKLPTFFPAGLSVSMIAPEDVALFAADLVCGERGPGTCEISGPREYTSVQVARVFGEYLGRQVEVQEVPLEQLVGILTGAGMSKDAALNMERMTAAVIDGRTGAQFPEQVIRLGTTLEEYLRGQG